MVYIALSLLCLGLLASTAFFFLRSRELSAKLLRSTEREQGLAAELKKLEKYRDIPDVIERAKRTKADAESRLAAAKEEAKNILLKATIEASEFLSASQADAKVALTKARKEAKDKEREAEETLALATQYAHEIRLQAENSAREIDREAFEAKGRAERYRALEQAIKNRIDGYQGSFPVPSTHVIDELAAEFGFSNAGKKLKLARQRSKLMRDNRTAASCGYPDGWKKDHAIKFVLSTFDGNVDTILARIKPGNQGKLIQEIRDAYAEVNKDGEVYKNARIEKEYLDSRLDEVKWAVAVEKIKEKNREEQRAIREQMREEQKARKEIERAIKQAEREEELVNKAIEKIKKQFEQASEAEKARLEAQLQELNTKLVEAEERGKKAISMAQQTKRGHVYIISNIGSFGEDVYKIGLTRRLDPGQRVRELGDASVPFPFDVHAMIAAEDAPALEFALHKQFVDRQVNKINRRKEFFRVSVHELKKVIGDLGIEASWTIEAEAAQYRETLALEKAMSKDADLRKKWLEDQSSFEAEDEESEELEQVEQ